MVSSPRGSARHPTFNTPIDGDVGHAVKPIERNICMIHCEGAPSWHFAIFALHIHLLWMEGCRTAGLDSSFEHLRIVIHGPMAFKMVVSSFKHVKDSEP